MRKINFNYLQIPLDLKGLQVQAVDVRKDIGNYIYTTRTKIEDKRLAEKIYDSGGELELTNEESMLLLSIVEESTLTLPFKDAIRKSLED